MTQAPSAAVPAAPATPLPSSVRKGLPNACPACGEPREEPDARFCEVCRFDFVAKRPGPPPAGAAPKSVNPPIVAAQKPAVAPQPGSFVPAAPAAGATGAQAALELVVSIDPALDTEPEADSPCPTGVADVVVALDRPELLVGRRDERRDIHPELPVSDPGASRRHAKFVLAADGGLVLLDLASTNGTKLNGVEVPSGSRTPLKEGDAVTLGRWTRISVRRRP
jgi:hypothetical protein